MTFRAPQSRPYASKERGAHADGAECRWRLAENEAFEFPIHSKWLFDQVHSALAKRVPINLSESDVLELERLVEQPAQFPDGASVRASFLSREGKQLILLDGGVNGPSASRVMARFAHLDKELLEGLRAHIGACEQNPDAIYAEVIHVNTGRMGNVVARPQLSDYEIGYLSTPSVGEDYQIPINDLLISVREDRVILWSQKFDKEVIPRVSTAYAYKIEGLPIYQLLSMTQVQGKSGLHWSWGGLESILPHLPRVEYRGVVLSLERWQVQARDYKNIVSRTGTERIMAARALRQAIGLPRHVFLADDDNKLPLDMENIASLDAFSALASARTQVDLIEDLWTGSSSLLGGPGGDHVHELTIGVENASSVPLTGRYSEGPFKASADFERRLYPFADMFALKVYSGWSIADKILLALREGIVEPLQAAGALDRWFFIRYRDDHPHIRLRLFGPNIYTHASGRVLEALRSYLDVNQVWKIQTDTYVRELERYGGCELTRSAEKIFYADSDLVTRFIEYESVSDSKPPRWVAAAASVHSLIKEFFPEVEEGLAFLEKVSSFNGTDRRVQMGGRYRELRSNVESIVAGQIDAMLSKLLEDRKVQISAEIAIIKAKAASTNLPNILLSHCHMAVNRMLNNNQPRAEAVIYDYLRRAYLTTLKRGQKKSSSYNNQQSKIHSIN